MRQLILFCFTLLCSAGFPVGERLESAKNNIALDSPDGKTRSHLTAFISKDDGKTWQGGLLPDERKGVSYPDITEGYSGNIYCIYDYSRQDKMEILMAVFTEEDILNSANLPDFRSRVLINKATGRKIDN